MQHTILYLSASHHVHTKFYTAKRTCRVRQAASGSEPYNLALAASMYQSAKQSQQNSYSCRPASPKSCFSWAAVLSATTCKESRHYHNFAWLAVAFGLVCTMAVATSNQSTLCGCQEHCFICWPRSRRPVKVTECLPHFTWVPRPQRYFQCWCLSLACRQLPHIRHALSHHQSTVYIRP